VWGLIIAPSIKTEGKVVQRAQKVGAAALRQDLEPDHHRGSRTPTASSTTYYRWMENIPSKPPGTIEWE
jgi:hypothetical protein